MCVRAEGQFGLYRISEVIARSMSVIVTSGSIFTLKRAGSESVQGGVGISRTRTQ